MKNSRERNSKTRKEIIMNIPNTNKPHRNHAAELLGAAFLCILLLALSIGTSSAAPKSPPAPTATLLVSGLEGTQGSTVVPGGGALGTGKNGRGGTGRGARHRAQ